MASREHFVSGRSTVFLDSFAMVHMGVLERKRREKERECIVHVVGKLTRCLYRFARTAIYLKHTEKTSRFSLVSLLW